MVQILQLPVPSFKELKTLVEVGHKLSKPCQVYSGYCKWIITFLCVPCALSVLSRKTRQFSAAQGVCSWLQQQCLGKHPECLAGSELVKPSGKMSLGEILCDLLSATNIVLNQKCLNHRESNWLFHTSSAPWELHLDGLLQRMRETCHSSWKSSVEYIFRAA